MAKKKSRHEIAQAQIETGAAEPPAPGEQAIDIGGWRVSIEATCADRCRLTSEQRDGFTLVHVDLPADAPGEYTIVARQPCIDVHRSWVGAIDCWRGSELTSIALNYSFDAAANNSIPVICNYNRQGVSQCVVGLLDQLPVTHINQRAEIEKPPMQWLRMRFTRNLGQHAKRETLVISRETVHFVQAVRRFLRFCRDTQNITPLPAPNWARKPVWCSWYSHLYSLTQSDIEKHIPLLKSLGFETVLIDASWFKPTEVALHRVWGDFQPHTPLMPDLPALSRKLHDAGLRLMLWCSPWYVGVDADCRERMAPYCGLEDGERSDRLCVFCDEAHTFAADSMRRVMTDYELDGLKLDFLDRIGPACTDPAHKHGDTHFGAAMARFLASVRNGILSANPDAAIEYRLHYSNVCTLPYANCHRGNDSPYDGDYIRRENLFVRLFADHPSAAWSDYAYWHADESPENVSLLLGQQILSGGVPTVSINLETCSPAHRDVIREWLTFYADHADALARADLHVHSADSAMSVSSFRHNQAAYILLAGQHIPRHLDLGAKVTHAWVLNCTAELDGATMIRDQSHDLSGRALKRIDL